jgi:hypothetical protein
MSPPLSRGVFMKRQVTALLGAAAMVLSAAAASAQDKPNFAGKWTLDAEKTAAANPGMQGGGGGGGGRPGGRGGMGMGPLTLAIDGNTLTRTTEGRDGPMSTTFKLDDSEQTVTMGQGSAKVKAKWDGNGNSIVIETTRQTENGEVKSTAVYTIEGEWLVISNTQPPRGGGDPVTRKSYYKRG